MSSEASWCSANGPDSGVGRSALCADGPAFPVGLSTIPAGCCTIIVLFSIFVAVYFSSMHFGLHFFCGAGYCGCVSLNIFSASFPWFSFALRRCNFRFWDRVNPDGHHRDMEYFGSAILMAVVSSFLIVLADSPKIIGPSLCSCMTTSVIPILIMSFFVVLSVAVDICPPFGLVGLCGRVVRQSCWAYA
jgi:Na+/proline symporter